MTRLATRAERVKLGRLLGEEPEELAFLDVLEPGQLRELRERITAALFDDHLAMFRRLAAAAKLLPAALVAQLGRTVFGPMLCARIAGVMPSQRAVDVAAKMPIAFLADVCLELDPRRARDVIAGIPVDRVVAVAHELRARGEYITMARFVDALPDSTIKAVIDDTDDDRALLEVAFFVESPRRLESIVGLLSEARLRRVLRLATADADRLWPDALAMMGNLSAGLLRRLGDIAIAEDEGVLGSMVRVVQRQGLWVAVLPIVSLMSEAAQTRLINLPMIQAPEVLRSIVAAADAAQAWTQLLPLAERMDAEGRRRLAGLAEALESQTIGRIAAAAQAQSLWAPLADIVERLPEARQQAVARALADAGDAGVASLLEWARRNGAWERLAPLRRVLQRDR